MNALIAFVLATVMLLGGGATAVAAQDDLPTEPLYQLKVWTENTRLSLAGDPQEQANLLMQMSQTRVEEMAGLIDQGIVPPAQVQERLEQHLQQALMLATDMDDPDMTQTLLQLREHLQTQDRIMEQLQIHASADTEPLLTQTRQMLQTRLMLVEEGLADSQGFRYMMDNQMQYGQGNEDPEPNQLGEPGFHQNGQEEQNDNGNQNMNGQDEETPGNQFQNNTQNSQSGSQDQNSGSDSPGGQDEGNHKGGNESDMGNENGFGEKGGGNK